MYATACNGQNCVCMHHIIVRYDCETRTTMDDNSALPCYYFVFTLVCNAKKELISHVWEERVEYQPLNVWDTNFSFSISFISWI